MSEPADDATPPRGAGVGVGVGAAASASAHLPIEIGGGGRRTMLAIMLANSDRMLAIMLAIVVVRGVGTSR